MFNFNRNVIPYKCRYIYLFDLSKPNKLTISFVVLYASILLKITINKKSFPEPNWNRMFSFPNFSNC
ncbi:hypothetical protein BpHYR1_006964 [Brachionus plicatilis]|uniref:Uncharacterized protein n=1 Tax=Brachionus plicatilis TaxID=10195 RepID=A0A3M7PI05_BRAPC|nr:hypothetical protein BpHYR1_006964 [Brachionus plicatilis]